MFEDGCSKQSNFRAQRFSSKVNEERERDSYLVILSYLKLLYFFLSITKTFIPKESSKTYRKSRIEEYDKRNLFRILGAILNIRCFITILSVRKNSNW
jgi:hypothetical protein